MASGRADRRAPWPNAAGVSLVLPCLDNQATLAASLEALRRQTLPPSETIMVDSSASSECEAIVRSRFPEVRYERVGSRLLPHAARNRGVANAGGGILVFTDPDTYARPDWLERLVASHRATGHITVGAIACHGRRRVDLGNHICKFSKWLPGGVPRPVDSAPTANLLCPRALFERLGGFAGDRVHGDTLFSWTARRRGHVLWFAPDAVVAHHHLQGVRQLVRERHERGRLFGAMRADLWGNRRGTLLLYLAASMLPARLLRILALTTAQCRRAGYLGELVATHPVVVLGHLAGLLGECRTYAARLAARRPPGGG